MSLKNPPGNQKLQAAIDVLRREHPAASIDTVSYDGDLYELIIEQDTVVYFVGIRLARAAMQTVARLLLYSRTIAQRYPDRKVVVRLYAPAITPDAKAALIKAGGAFQKLPESKPRRTAADTIKITSPGSWKVVSFFLRNEEATMNQASVQTGVSYPWTRSVVRKLIEIGALEEESRKVRLTSLEKLFEYVAWERPINSLRSLEFTSAYHDEQEALHELYGNAAGIIPQSACALFTAADLYLEGVASGGCVQLYAEENAALVAKSLLGEGDGVSFQIYAPDREFEEVYSINDVRVVSPEQTVLDLAGLGTYGAEAAKVIAGLYAKMR